MGRYDLRPARVLQTAKQHLATRLSDRLPIWYDVIQSIPPASTQTLVRPARRGKKSKMFQPVSIKYQEDELRLEFFGDHPWELARPRVIVEGSGNDARDWDWSRLKQPGKPLDGESVIQRQLWLMRNEGLAKDAAYDKSRKEFYRYRMREDIQRRIAKEEALACGAYFGKGPNEIGMQLEDAQYEDWKRWAELEVQKAEQRASSGYSSTEDADLSLSPAEEEAGAEAVVGAGQTPGQTAGGAFAYAGAYDDVQPTKS